MAQTTYVSRQAVTLGTRDIAYTRLRHFIGHLHGWNLNLLSVSLTGGNFVQIVLNNPIPGGAEQLDHFGINEEVV